MSALALVVALRAAALPELPGETLNAGDYFDFDSFGTTFRTLESSRVQRENGFRRRLCCFWGALHDPPEPPPKLTGCDRVSGVLMHGFGCPLDTSAATVAAVFSL
ncbi:hypothetical protein G5B39_01480 [Rhodobacteraceae bacterium SC52]|nr:hypothetical protein G5B39_01480 [Rhodobacteraceae bacterium SC52]